MCSTFTNLTDGGREVQELWNALNEAPEESWCAIKSAEVRGAQGLDIELEIWPIYTGLDEPFQVVSVGCDAVRHAQLPMGEAFEVALLEDHPLLYEHYGPQARLSFRGRASSVSEILGDLYQAHVRLLGQWVPFGRYFNENIGVVELLAGGYGTLAEGPVVVLHAYREVLAAHGVNATMPDQRAAKYFRAGADSEGWVEQKAPLSVLLLGTDAFHSAYVVAEAFTATT